MAKHIFQRSIFLSPSLLAGLKDTYDPDILLDFNQEAGFGSTIPDVSGNGRTFVRARD